MASIRKVKKSVHYTCGDLAAEILIASHAINGFDREKAYKIVNDIAALQTDSISKCSFSFDKARKDFENESAYNKAKAAYYRAAFNKLITSFNDRVVEIVKEMNAALPGKTKAE